MVFVDPSEKRETWVVVFLESDFRSVDEFCPAQILLGHIGSIERLPMLTAGTPLLIRGKTFFSLTFVVGKDSDCQDIHSALLRLAQPSE